MPRWTQTARYLCGVLCPNGDVTLATFEEQLKKSHETGFDLSRCRFTDAYGLVALACAAEMHYRQLSYHHRPVSYSTPRSNDVRRYHQRMHLPDAIQRATGIGPDVPVALREADRARSLCEVRQVRAEDHDHSSLPELVMKRLGEHAPQSVVEALYQCLVETLANIVDHSKAKRGYVAAQVYASGRPNEHIVIGIGDTGIGLRKSLGEKAADLTEREILPAIVKGGLTETDDPKRGYGLHQMTDLVTRVGGSVVLRSGSARLAIESMDQLEPQIVPHLAGTLVGVNIPFPRKVA